MSFTFTRLSSRKKFLPVLDRGKGKVDRPRVICAPNKEQLAFQTELKGWGKKD